VMDKRSKLQQGRCFACWCTDDLGCDVGCSWVDPDHTMCSACEGLAMAYSRWLALTAARRRGPKASGKRKAVR
jgi:hypothetical protein